MTAEGMDWFMQWRLSTVYLTLCYKGFRSP